MTATLIYLKGYFCIQFKLFDLLDPRLKLLCLRVDEIVEDGALRWELYCLEFCCPPFGEFHSVIHQLRNKSKKKMLYRTIKVVCNIIIMTLYL